MCGRYTLGEPSEIAAHYGFVDLRDTKIEPPFNIVPPDLTLLAACRVVRENIRVTGCQTLRDARLRTPVRADRTSAATTIRL